MRVGVWAACASFLLVSAAVVPVHALNAEYVDDDTVAVVNAAKARYGPNVTVYNATEPLFSVVFPDHQLKVVRSVDAHGVQLNHVMAYRPLTESAFDLTREFPGLLVDGGVVPSTSAQALNVGKVYALLANAEIQLNRTIATAANSTELNHTISDPAATAVLGGWQVTMTTWGPQWGAIINWTVNLTTASITSSNGIVVANGRGGFNGDLREVYPRENLSITNAHSPTYTVTLREHDTLLVAPWDIGTLQSTLIAESPTFDNSRVKVKYFGLGQIPSSAYPQAQLLANSLAWAYNRTIEKTLAIEESNGPRHESCNDVNGTQPNLPYRYPINDTDCILEIIIQDHLVVGSPMASGSTANHVRVLATAGYRAALAKAGVEPDPDACDDDCLVRVIMTHELFHGIQLVIAPKVKSNWIIAAEGMTRMRETLATGNYSQVSGSLWYHTLKTARSSGTTREIPPSTESPFTYQYSELDFCDLDYTSAGYWGSVYERNGGLATLDDIMYRMNANSGAICLDNVASLIDAALLHAQTIGINKNETTFNASLVEYATRFYQKNFSWGDPFNENKSQNWSQYQADVPNMTQDEGSVRYRVPAYGFAYVALPTNRTYKVSCIAEGGWSQNVMRRSASGWQPNNPLACGSDMEITGAAWEKVVLVLVRQAKEEDRSRITITEV